MSNIGKRYNLPKNGETDSENLVTACSLLGSALYILDEVAGDDTESEAYMLADEIRAFLYQNTE